jgi:lipopolysaccharide transport system ATP-binding protein
MDRGEARLLGGVDVVLAAYLAEVNRREEAELQLTTRDELDTSPGRMGIRITAVDLSGPDGPTPVFNTGDPLTLSVGYAAPIPLKGVRFSVTFLRGDGVPILTVPTDDLETGDATLPREGTVQLVVPGVPFLEGLYRVNVVIANIASGEQYKRVEKVRPFRVHSAERHEVGMALLGYSWELPRVATRAGRR